MKTKNKSVVRSISIKEESKKCYVLIKKRLIKGEKDITPMNFAEHLRKSDVSENSKVYYVQFLQNGIHEGIDILVQLLRVDEMYNILKSAGHRLLVER